MATLTRAAADPVQLARSLSLADLREHLVTDDAAACTGATIRRQPPFARRTSKSDRR